MSGARSGPPRALAAVALLVVLMVAVAAQAQPASALGEPPSHAQGRGGLRVVHLRNGGFVRGTIVASTSDALTVHRIDGETVRIARGDVARVGPMHEGRDRRRDPRVRVRFVADEPGVALAISMGGHERFVISGTPVQSLFGVNGSRTNETIEVQPEVASDRERVCIAPCSFDIAPGSYRFALAIGDRLTHPAAPLELRGPTVLQGVFESHETARMTGLALVLASPLAVVAALVVTFMQPDLFLPSFAAATGLFLTMAVTGVVLLLHEDQARFRLRPLVEPRPPR